MFFSSNVFFAKLLETFFCSLYMIFFFFFIENIKKMNKHGYALWVSHPPHHMWVQLVFSFSFQSNIQVPTFIPILYYTCVPSISIPFHSFIYHHHYNSFFFFSRSSYISFFHILLLYSFIIHLYWVIIQLSFYMNNLHNIN